MSYLNWKPNAKDYWITDVETDGLSPTRIHCAVSRNLGSDEVLTFTPDDMVPDGKFVQFLKGVHYVIGHNFLSFDRRQIARLLDYEIPRGRIVDSLVLSYLYNPHLPIPEGLLKYNAENGTRHGPHSLIAYGYRFNLAKIEYEDWSRYSPEMLERCKRDVDINVLTYKGLCERMSKIGYSEKSCLLEHEIRDVIDRQQERGFYFDRPEADRLVGVLQEDLRKLEGPIRELFPPVLTERGSYNFKLRADGQPYASYLRHVSSYDAVKMSASGDEYSVWDYQDFDIASPQQRIKKLLSLGWEPEELTPAGNPKVNEDNLKKFADSSGIPEITAIADWVVRNSRLSTINSWLSFCQEDSRIHGKVFTCGAASRRMIHKAPNTANIIKASADIFFGKEMRGLWTATPGRILMGYDVSGLEMRGFLHYLWPTASKRDREYLWEQYIKGKPHGKNAEALSKALGFEVSYDTSKTLYFAFLYGAGDKKLGTILGKTPGVGKMARETLLSSVPGLRAAVETVQREFNDSGGLIQTIDGGFVRPSGEHSAFNYQIQSTGAVLCKLAAILFDKEIHRQGLDVWQVAAIHDEYQNDCLDQKTAEEAGKVAVDCIRQAGEELGFNVPMTGEAHIGFRWSETH